MEEFIKDKMKIIFSDFLDNVAKESLCDLRSFSFKGQKLPNYSNLKHQQLFLLRYFPAYLCEYKYLYGKVHQEARLSEYNVLSIGCGCFLDYHGLAFALPTSPKPIRYTGIDIVNWYYNDIFFDSNIVEFSEILIENYQFPEVVDYNIIFFPKSISEISNKGFNILLENLQKVKFTSDCIYIISSSMDKGYEHDEAKYKRLIECLKKNGFNCNNYESTWELKNQAFCNLDGHFYYPDEVKRYLTTLHKNCLKYEKNNSSCWDKCEEISRWPILTTKHVSFLINLLER